jgi:putative ABC transport system permease protein
MRMPLIEGRDFAKADSAEAVPVALISQATARRYWPSDHPIGRRIRFTPFDEGQPWVEIIGVVGDVRNSDADAAVIPQVYVPSSQRPERTRAIVVRTEGPDPAALTPAIRSQVARLDKDLPVYEVSSMDQVLFDDLGGTYLIVGILAALALIALGLAASGIYGVVSYSVTQRTREFGIRMALGAQPRAVLRMVLAQGLGPVAVGGLLGLAGGVALVRATSAGMSEVNPNAPLMYIGVTVCLSVVALFATYIPARRVFRGDPMAALRYE